MMEMKKNGPYQLSNARLTDGLNVMDSVDKLYVTQMSDFASYFGFPGTTSSSERVDGLIWNYKITDYKVTLIRELDIGSFPILMCAVMKLWGTGEEVAIPASLAGCPVVCIGESAFDDCSWIHELTIPASVADIHKNAFSGCNGLTNVIFKGNAPKVDDQVFAEMAGCQVSVCEGTVGWDDDGDGLWNGMRLSYYEPEVDEWEGLDKQVQYLVRFNANGGSGAMPVKACVRDAVYCLPTNSFSAPAGKRFVGWACSNGRRYDDGMLIFGLADPGETVTMAAIWE